MAPPSVNSLIASQVKIVQYFQNDYLSVTEEQYLTQKGIFVNKLKSYLPASTPGTSNNEGPN